MFGKGTMFHQLVVAWAILIMIEEGVNLCSLFASEEIVLVDLSFWFSSSDF